MNTILRAAAIGAVSGSRSMMGPAMFARQAMAGRAGRAMPFLVAGEMLADKHPRMPARTTLMPLAGRMMTGAFAAGAGARGRRRVVAAIAGAAGAVAAAYALSHLRRYAASRRMSNVVAGAIEDGLVIAAAALLARAGSAPQRYAD
jgi:uncharacterized membrane protein